VLATVHLGDPLLAESARADLPVVLMNGWRTTTACRRSRWTTSAASGWPWPTWLASAHPHRAHRRPQEVSTGLARFPGLHRRHGGARPGADPELIVTAKSFSIDEGMRCAQLLLQRDAGCTAVAAGNDMLAIGCYGALDEAGCPARRTCPWWGSTTCRSSTGCARR